MKRTILKLLSFYSCLILLGDVGYGQNTNGNFRSRQSGNWNGTTTWQLRTSGSWANTTSIPSSGDVVSIQNGHTITLDANSSSGDIHLNTGGVLACSTFVLSATGKIRAYTGTAVTSLLDATYTSSTSPVNGNVTCGSGGRLKFTGNTRNITVASEWGANGLTTSAIVEFALTAGQTGTLNTGFKANTFIISSGTIDMGANRLAPDNGTAGQGDVTIASSAILISSASSTGNPVMSRTGTASTGRSGTFTLNGILKLNGASPYIEFNTVSLNVGSTVEFNGGAQTWINASYSGADPIDTYSNVTLLGSAVTKTTVASQTTTVNGTLSMQGTATLTLGTSSTLIFGSSSTLEYKGSAAQATGVNPAEWPASNGPYNLTLNNSNGLTLGVGRTINGTINLTSGLLTTTSSNLLSLSSTGTVTSVSNTSFINGPFKKTGNTSFIFPVGKSGTGYQAIEISAPSNIADAFTAEYMRANPSTLGSVLSGGLSKISGCEYWQLDHTTGTSNVDVILYGNANSGCSSATGANYFTGGGAVLTDLKVCHFNNGTSIWENNGGTTSGSSPDITTTAASISSFGSFTFGTIAMNPLPVKLISFTAKLQKDNAELEWSTATEKNNDHFDIERSVNGVDYIEVGEVIGKGNTDNISSYYFIDSNVSQPATQIVYYRLKQVDYDGKFLYSNIVTLTIVIQNSFSILDVYPDPFRNIFSANYYLPCDGKINITITDATGRVIYGREEPSRKGINVVHFSSENFTPGLYFIAINYEGKIIQRKIRMME